MDFDPKQAAAVLGRLGGLKKSARKAAACRANGKLARRKKTEPEPAPVIQAAQERPSTFLADQNET